MLPQQVSPAGKFREFRDSLEEETKGHQKRGEGGGRDLLTPQPGVGDVLQHGDRHAEEDDEQVAESQGADEDIGDGAHGLAAGHHIDHQGVSEECQGKDDQAGEQESQPDTGGQLRGEHQWP